MNFVMRIFLMMVGLIILNGDCNGMFVKTGGRKFCSMTKAKKFKISYSKDLSITLKTWLYENKFESAHGNFPLKVDMGGWIGDEEISPIFCAINQNKPEIVKALVEISNVDVNVKWQGSVTPLLAVLNLCLDQQYWWDLYEKPPSKVWSFSSPETLEIIKLFIARGANVNDVDEIGVTALHLAAHAGDVAEQFVRLFLESGANIKAEDDLGHCPLYWALGSPNVSKKITKILRNFNDNSNVKRWRHLDLTEQPRKE